MSEEYRNCEVGAKYAAYVCDSLREEAGSKIVLEDVRNVITRKDLGTRVCIKRRKGGGNVLLNYCPFCGSMVTNPAAFENEA